MLGPVLKRTGVLLGQGGQRGCVQQGAAARRRAGRHGLRAAALHAGARRRDADGGVGKASTPATSRFGQGVGPLPVWLPPAPQGWPAKPATGGSPVKPQESAEPTRIPAQALDRRMPDKLKLPLPPSPPCCWRCSWCAAATAGCVPTRNRRWGCPSSTGHRRSCLAPVAGGWMVVLGW